jgi:pimeloyl-ACP methyl ester carboxylesterase
MRTLLRVLSGFAAIPAALFLLFVLTSPGTWSGIAYALGLVTLTIAGASLGKSWARKLAAGGAGSIALTIVVRLFTASRGDAMVMNTGTTPGSRFVNRVVDEEDLSVSAARTMRVTGFMHDPDVSVLPEEMTSAYARMRAAQGDGPSPVLATYLGLEGPGAYDAIEVGDVEHASGVVVFLHGFAGSFALPCWEVSRAAARVGMATVCPATRWVGDWWNTAGETTLREVVTNLHSRGQKHLILAGLSNGGIGGSLLVTRFPGSFEGFIAISGASPQASAPGIPVLCVQGEYDAQIAASVVRAYATRSGATYVSLPVGHFALLVKEDEVVDAMATWLGVRAAGWGTHEVASH